MKKEILVKQHDYKDCGAACLVSICAYYGRLISIARVRQICHTDTRGTNLLGLIRGLNDLGFNAKGVKGDLDSITKIPLPSIAHVIVNKTMHHYVVIYKVHKNIVSFMDPAKGKIEA